MEGLVSLVIFALIIFRIIMKTQKGVSSTRKPVSSGGNVKADLTHAVKQEAVNVDFQPNVNKRLTTSPRVSGVNKNLHGGTQGSNQVVNMRSRTTLAALSAEMENRGNDWLAKQLADERAAKRRMSDMFDLKQQHAENCDAAHNRMSHVSNCDANGVDMARG